MLAGRAHKCALAGHAATAALFRATGASNVALAHSMPPEGHFERTWTSPLAPIVRQLEEFGRPQPKLSHTVLNRARPATELLQELSVDERKLLAIVHAERQMLRDMGAPAPLSLSAEEQLQLLSLPNRQKRESHLAFLFLKSSIKYQDKVRQAVNHAAHLERKKDIVTGEDMPNRVFDSKSVKNQFKRHLMHRKFNSVLWGQPFVLDMDFERHMSEAVLANMVKQTVLVSALNGQLREPFHLHFCNVRIGGKQHAYMQKYFVAPFAGHARTKIASLEDLPCTVTSKDPTECFPVEDLVYLTPDARADLTEVRPDKVYIIGGLNDKSYIENITYVKCKKLGISMARLPLDTHLKWESGAKTLTLDVCFNIMAEQKSTGSWVTALEKHVPKRHLQPIIPFSKVQLPTKYGVLNPRKKFFAGGNES